MARRRTMILPAALSAVLLSATACASLPSSGSSSSKSVNIDIVAEVTGSQAPSTAMWIAGVQQAAKEINASGGILGRKVHLDTIDDRSDPATSIASMRLALQNKPYVVLGTVLSSATLVNMSVLQNAGVPQITGSVSPAIAAKKPTSLFYVEPNASMEATMFTHWMVDKAHVKRVAIIYSTDEFGVSGDQAFTSEFKKNGVKVVDQLASPVGQTSFADDIARIQSSKPDTVFMYMHETETGRFLQQAKAAGLTSTTKFMGASSALAQSTVQLAGPAANGVEGFVPYSLAVPDMSALAKDFEKLHGGAAPDHNYYKGYVALWMVAYATEKIGKFDQKAMVKALKGQTWCVSKYPHLLENTRWDSDGNIYRDTFIVKIVNQKPQLLDTIPPLSSAGFASCS